MQLQEFRHLLTSHPILRIKHLKLKLSQPSRNERKQTRKHCQDQRGNGEDNELSWWPEGEAGEQRHEDMDKSGDGHRLLSVRFNRCVLFSDLLRALLDPRCVQSQQHEDVKPLVPARIEGTDNDTRRWRFTHPWTTREIWRQMFYTCFWCTVRVVICAS